MGFRAYADHHKTKQHQSQVEQEENQKVHPGSTKEHKERDCYWGMYSNAYSQTLIP